MKILSVVFFSLFIFSLPAFSAENNEVMLGRLTSPEVGDRIKAGYRTILIPTGGTEQNGAHMVLGKHNFIVTYTAGEIAKKLGKTLVAPTIAYVPEGEINPPAGHMAFAGTISVSEETYEGLLRDTAASMKTHGFKLIAFVGDSGGNQSVQDRLAEELSETWEEDGVRVVNVGEYYNASHAQDEYLGKQGFSAEEIGTHAAMEDTSELMAVYPEGIRKHKLAKHSAADSATSGATGDSRKASAKLGKILLQMKIDAAVRQLTPLM